ncbi:hypothetical protein IPM19_03055 [bacterium]|nr:MAG: hypothetical protein IPM19_03055 [bacterium]
MKIKPINVVFDSNVPNSLKNATSMAVSQLVNLAGLTYQMSINNYGVWRQEDWQDEQGNLLPFHSVDW